MKQILTIYTLPVLLYFSININAKKTQIPFFNGEKMNQIESSFMNQHKIKKEEGVLSNEVIIQIVPCVVCADNHDRSLSKTASTQQIRN